MLIFTAHAAVHREVAMAAPRGRPIGAGRLWHPMPDGHDVGLRLRNVALGKAKSRDQKSCSHTRRPGDNGGVAAPDPIPNSAVKRPSADGTSS